MVILDSKKIFISAILAMLLAMIIVSSAAISFIGRDIKTCFNKENQPDHVSTSEILSQGDVGKLADIGDENNSGVLPENIKLPAVIFNVSGTIAEIKKDQLIIKGDGSNFEDGIRRDLSAIFIDQTATFISSGEKNIKYQGAEGLKRLKIGENILIEGEENIRGKIEFKARTVNIIK
jgi:hypothetical protein